MANTQDGPGLLPGTRALAEGKNFAAMATVLPSGLIQNQVIWVGTDGDRLVVNTEPHRAKFRNLQLDDRLTLMIWDASDPYHFAEVRGHATGTVAGQRARAHIDELSRKYTGEDYPGDDIRTERVMIFVAPERQLIRGASPAPEAE